MRCVMIGCLLLGLLGFTGCSFNIDLGADSLFSTGSAFVLKGTTDVVETAEGPCLVWLGRNGETYHLFQTSRIDNEDFDRVVTPGVTSRLEIAVRGDLTVDCQVGPVVEVQRVLEIES